MFNTEYNISFFIPKKDKCETCTAFDLADAGTKAEMQSKYERHKLNKTQARKLKDADKDLAVNDKTICFDLQNVLAIPQSEVSSFYYKSKYATYNFTVHDMGNNKGFCYVWHEVIAKRGPNEISSCVWKFLKAQHSNGVKKVIPTLFR